MPELPELSKLTRAEMYELLIQFHQLIKAQEARIKELEGQVSKDSHNSSKLPSSDGAKKPPASNQKSQREKGKRKVGGQAGHAKHGLEHSATPDKIEQHKPHSCMTPYLEDALDELALLPSPSPNAKGKPKQHPAKNLHSRLVKKKAEVLQHFPLKK